MIDYDKRLAEASKTLGAGALKMIGLILQKHDAAVIEASVEAIEAAVRAEREACAKICELGIVEKQHPESHLNVGLQWAADAIRERGVA